MGCAVRLVTDIITSGTELTCHISANSLVYLNGSIFFILLQVLTPIESLRQCLSLSYSHPNILNIVSLCLIMGCC